MVPQVENSNVLLIGFDLDGTLIDSSEDIRDALRTVLGQNELNQELADKVRIGAPFREMMRPHLNVSEAVLDHLFLDFRRIYDYSGFPKTQSYQGCEDALNWLQDSGYKMFLATNKPQVATQKILHQLELDSYFFCCFTPDGFGPNRMSKTEMLKKAVVEYSKGQQILYVGDSIDDIKACRPHSIISVAACYGYYSGEELSKAAPAYSIASLSELKNLVSSLKVNHT